MMRKCSIVVLVFIFVFTLSNKVKAQYNVMNLYDQHFNFMGADFLPSKLGEDYSTFQMQLSPIIPSIYVYAGNSFMNIDGLLYPNTESIDDAINNAGNFALFGVGTELPTFSFGYKVRKDNKELMSFSLKTNHRGLANVLIGGNFLSLLWKGNKQFEGQTVSLGKFGLNAFHASTISLGWAMPFDLPNTDLKLRAGASLKYVLSAGGINLEEVSPTFTTATDGKSIGFDNLSYKLNYASPEGGLPGKGFGMDLGVTLKHPDGFIGSVSILDIGKINYSGNTRSFTGDGSFTFDGIVIEDIFNSPEINVDSTLLEDIKGVSDSGQAFSISLPTRLVLQLEKNIGAKTNKKGREYVKHGVYLTYIQGFNDIAGTTTKPFFSGGYSYSLNYVLNVGPTINYGGYGKLGIGAFASVRAGGFRLGFGTSSGLSYLLAPKSAASADFSFMTTFAFGNTEKWTKPSKKNKKDKKETKKGKDKDENVIDEKKGSSKKGTDPDAQYEEEKEKVKNKIAE